VADSKQDKNKLQRLRILVVDDDHIMRELLKSVLRREQLNVVGDACDGEAALLQCEKLEPNVVCLDFSMPKMDGIQALQSIRAKYPDIKVIMVSAEATLDVVRDAISKGACGFIVMPYNAAKILDTLDRCIT
jgi:two-component system chemotaxis response regulator CheY